MSLQRMYMAMTGVAAPASPMFTGDPFQAQDFGFGFVEAGIEIDADGGIEAFNSGGNLGDIGRWDGGGSFVRADFDFRADKSSGFGNLDAPFVQSVWYAGSSLISFKVSNSFSVDNWSGTLRMRPTGGGSDIDTASLQLTAEGI